MRIGIVSLGCPKNLVDSELILGKLAGACYVLARNVDESDVILLNTCGFIHDAKEESIDAILDLIELKKTGKIRALIVMGCLVQRYSKELQKNFKEVDAFLGSGDYQKIGSILEKVLIGKKSANVEELGYLGLSNEKRSPLTPRYYRYLKISEGCNHTCSFCVIPKIRGKFRSRKIPDVLREAKRLVKEGAKELILIGQDTTQFGCDYAGKPLLAQLLRKLDKLKGLKWIRLLYTYPSSVTDELIEVMAASRKICRYIDIPLQHISDKILRSMRRGISKEKTLALVRKLRAKLPGLAIRTSFIVGYPGETEREFRELLQFIREMRFERLGIFKYSCEPGSRASELPNQVPEKIKEKRYHKAMRAQREIARETARCYIGKRLEVLLEGKCGDKPGMWQGRSGMDAPDIDTNVLIRSKKNLKPGHFYNVTITGTSEYDLVGQI